jgi:hypothetical protein
MKVGNMKIKQFHQLVSKIWNDIELLIEDSILINVYSDKIEAIR